MNAKKETGLIDPKRAIWDSLRRALEALERMQEDPTISRNELYQMISNVNAAYMILGTYMRKEKSER